LDVADHVRLGSDVEHALHVVTYGLTPAEMRRRFTADERHVPSLGPKRKPWPYQVEGYRFLMRCGSGFLTDEPGLGKTVSAILLALGWGGRTLVVGPSSAKGVWEQELEACDQPDIEVVEGRKPRETKARFVIINYDILAWHANELAKGGFTTVIFDEAHRLKDPFTKTTQAAFLLGDCIPHRYFLTGTPIITLASDVWPALSMLRPYDFPRLGRTFHGQTLFQRRYVKWKFIRMPDGSRKEVPSEDNPLMVHELKERMRPWMIHRKLSDIRTELPEIRYTTIPIELPADIRKAYDSLRRDPVEYWTEHGDAAKVEAVTKGGMLAVSNDLLAMTVAPKAMAAKDYIETFLAASEERKLLTFGSRLLGLDLLQAQYPSALRIDGSSSTQDRKDVVNRFQAPDGERLFLGQIRACSEALTLDRADTVLFLEADWSPARNFQAERRALRGNTDHHLHVATLVARNTIDETRQKVLARRAASARDFLSPSEEGNIVQETLREEFGVAA
jgi:SNF2 family DNA or RNA helicase